MKETDQEDLPLIKREEALKKKFKKEGFLKKLQPHTKPTGLVVAGLGFSMIQGAIFPIFAIFIMKEIFILSRYDEFVLEERLNVWKDRCLDWCLYMFFAALITLFAAFFQKTFFGYVGENITMAMRSNLY